MQIQILIGVGFNYFKTFQQNNVRAQTPAANKQTPKKKNWRRARVHCVNTKTKKHSSEISERRQKEIYQI